MIFVKKTHKFINKLLRKVIGISIVAFFLVCIICFYTITLIIAEPRELDFVDGIIEASLKKNYSNAEVNIGKTLLAWDKKNFSFNINLKDVEINIPNKFNSFAPNVKLDISRRNLLLYKFIIDQAIFEDAVIKIFSQTSKNQNKSLFTLAPVKIPVFFYNLDIKNSELHYLDKKISIENLKIRKDRSSNSLSVVSNKKENSLNISLKSICNIENDVLNICSGNVENINSKTLFQFINSKNIKNANFNFNLDYELNFNEQQNLIFNVTSGYGEVELTTEQKIIWDELDSVFKVELKTNKVKIDKLELFSSGNHLSTSVIYNLTNKDLSLSLGSVSSSKDFILNLWPKKVVPKLQKWLKKNINNTILRDVSFDLKLNTLNKKIENISLNADFSDADIKFSNKLKPLKKAKGSLEIRKNNFYVNVENARLEQIQINNLEAEIKNILVKKIHQLSINLNSKSNISELSRYLLNTDLKEFNLDGNTIGFINIKTPIAKGTTLEDIFFNAQLDIKKFNFDNILDNSKLQFNLTKNRNNNFINANINCISCYPDIPFLGFDNDIIKNEQFSLRVDTTPNKIKILDIQSKSDNSNFNLAADVFFSSDNKVEKFNLRDVILGSSKFNFSFENITEEPIFNLKASKLNLSLQKLINKFSGSNRDSSQIINIYSDLFTIDEKTIGSDLKFTSFKKAENSIIQFINFNIDGSDGYFIAKNYFSKTKSSVDIDIKNFGKLLNNLNITDKINNGNAIFSMEKDSGIYHGNFFLNKIIVTTNKFINKIQENESLGVKNTRKIEFNNGSGDFTIEESKVKLNHFSCFSNNLGITANGNITADSYHINGVIIPATTLNTLLGIKNIPFLGSFLTGGKDEGLISANYSAKGKIGEEATLSINPFSTLTPGILRKIFRLPKK